MLFAVVLRERCPAIVLPLVRFVKVAQIVRTHIVHVLAHCFAVVAVRLVGPCFQQVVKAGRRFADGRPLGYVEQVNGEPLRVAECHIARSFVVVGVPVFVGIHVPERFA